MANIKDTDIKSAIGWVLRIGVLSSIAIVLFGGVIYIYRHGHVVPDYRTFTGVPDIVHPGSIIAGMLAFRGTAIIQAGIILLIATPVIRIVFSAIGFIIEGDYLYVGITILVLLIILISMLTGHAA